MNKLPMKSVGEDRPDILKLRDEIVDALARVEDDMPVHDAVAVLAFVIGACMASMDDTLFTPETAMELVMINLTKGNRMMAKNAAILQ